MSLVDCTYKHWTGTYSHVRSLALEMGLSKLLNRPPGRENRCTCVADVLGDDQKDISGDADTGVDHKKTSQR